MTGLPRRTTECGKTARTAAVLLTVLIAVAGQRDAAALGGPPTGQEVAQQGAVATAGFLREAGLDWLAHRHSHRLVLDIPKGSMRIIVRTRDAMPTNLATAGGRPGPILLRTKARGRRLAREVKRLPVEIHAVFVFVPEEGRPVGDTHVFLTLRR